LDALVARAKWLLENFGDEPNYLRVYDSQGQARHVLWMIETIHPNRTDVTKAQWAAGFDTAADLIYGQTGHRPGFCIDPTPLPIFGSHYPHQIRDPNGRLIDDNANPVEPILRGTQSILAISPFDITSQSLGPIKPLDQITEDERTEYARTILTKWRNSGIPLIAPVNPGYDAHIVFPTQTIPYGLHPGWLLRQKDLVLEFGTDGGYFEMSDGWTEGKVFGFPSVEDGDTHVEALHDIVAALRHRWKELGD
jgi:hypothetical protein